MNIIILCGGTGTRLWPMSRSSKPKQFNQIISEKTMIEETVERFTGSFPKENIYFSTTPEQAEHIRATFQDLEEDHIIIEPEKRDSGPAMGYAAAYLQHKGETEPMVFIPCDHYIANTELFIKNIKDAEEIIKKTGKMMDIAITPTFPSTALGYTHVGEKSEESTEDTTVFEFKGHVEKPELEKAKELLATKEYLWHANFYMWTPEGFLNAYKQYAPEMYQHLEAIQEAWKKDNSKKVKVEYGQMEKISIDYAVTEKMDPSDVLIIEGTFGWSDIGTWDVLHDQTKDKHDSDDNLIKGEAELKDTKGSVVYNMNSKKKIISTIGVSDMIIIDTDDALLVCDKEKTQDVKKIVESLNEQGKKYT